MDVRSQYIIQEEDGNTALRVDIVSAVVDGKLEYAVDLFFVDKHVADGEVRRAKGMTGFTTSELRQLASFLVEVADYTEEMEADEELRKEAEIVPQEPEPVQQTPGPVAGFAKASPPGVTTAEFVRIEPTVFANDIRDATFEVLAKAMMRWLCENQHPHHTVLITPTHAELLEGSLAFTDESYLKD